MCFLVIVERSFAKGGRRRAKEIGVSSSLMPKRACFADLPPS